MITYSRRVFCVLLSLVLLSVQCSSIRINFEDNPLPKEQSNEFYEDSQSNEVESPPAVPLKIRLNEEVRDNLLLRIYSEDKLQKLVQKTEAAKTRVIRQASTAQLYPHLTPSPFQSQYYNNSSPNSNSQYGQTNSYDHLWHRLNNSQNYPVNPGYNPSYNPNTYGPSGVPNPYVQYNNSQRLPQFNIYRPPGPNYPSTVPGNYSRQPYNPSQYPGNNPGYNPGYNPSVPNYQPGQYPTPNPNYPSQRPSYNTPGNYPGQFNSSRPSYSPSYNPSQRTPYYNSSSSSPYYSNRPNSTNSFFNTTPRSSFEQFPNTNMNTNNPFYNPYPSGRNPAGFPDTDFGHSNPSRTFYGEEDPFKSILPKFPRGGYDPNKSPSENFKGL